MPKAKVEAVKVTVPMLKLGKRTFAEGKVISGKELDREVLSELKNGKGTLVEVKLSPEPVIEKKPEKVKIETVVVKDETPPGTIPDEESDKDEIIEEEKPEVEEEEELLDDTLIGKNAGNLPTVENTDEESTEDETPQSDEGENIEV